jgi:hypothetical protein
VSTLINGISDFGSDPAIAALAAIALIVLLIQHEVASAAGGLGRPYARSLLISAVPLLLVFAIIVSHRILRFP